MTKPILIWQNGVFPKSEIAAAKKYFNVEQLNFLDTEKLANLIEQDVPYSFRGSLAFASKLGFRQEKFNCSRWMPHFKDQMLSREFYWQIASMVKIPEGKELFIKPDSCKKFFAGQVFNAAKWKEELSFLKQKNSEKILCFCAEPEYMGFEGRCLFVGMELVGISVYMRNGEIIDKPFNLVMDHPLVDLAREIRKSDYFSPEENLTIDITKRLFQTGFCLVEINQLETGGWYSANPEPIYQALAKQL